MSDTSQGEGWWQAKDDKWYPPETHPDFAAEDVSADAAEVEGDTRSDTAGFVAPKALIIGAVVLGLVLVAFLASRMFGGVKTGAETPEIAAEQFLTSAYSFDIAGIATTINPDEVEAWNNGFVKPLSGWLGDIEAEGSAGDGEDALDIATDPLGQIRQLSDLVDLEVDGGTAGTKPLFTSEFLDDEQRMARITLETARARVTFNEDHPFTQDQALLLPENGVTTALNLSDLAGETIEVHVRSADNGSEVIVKDKDGSTISEQLEGHPISLIAIETGGRWHISPGYTLVEAGTLFFDYDPDYGQALRLIDSKTGGAKNPEDAIHDLFSVVENLDFGVLIDLIDPGSLPYLHDYFASAERDIQVRSGVSPTSTGVTIDSIETDVQSWNNRKVVKLKKLTATVDSETLVVDMATLCVTSTRSGREDQECLGTEIASSLGVSESQWLEAAPDHFGFVVVERNGRWFFDPIGSVGYMGELVKATSEKLPEGKRLEASEFVDRTSLLGHSTSGGHTGPLVTSSGTVQVDAINGLAGIGIDISKFAAAQTGRGFPKIDGTRLALVEVNGDGVSHFWPYEPQAPKFALVVDRAGTRDGTQLTFPALTVRSENPVNFTTSEIEVIDLVDESVSGTFNEAGHPILVQIATGVRSHFFVHGEDVSTSWIDLDSDAARWVYPVPNYFADTVEIEPNSTVLLWGNAGSEFTLSRTMPFVGEEVNHVDVEGEPLEEFVDGELDPVIGMSGPAISASSLVDNSNFRHNTYSGEPVIFAFVSHWCARCQVELPEIKVWLANNRLPQNAKVVVVSSAVDETKDNYPPAEWFNEVELEDVEVIADDAAGSFAEAFGVSSFPTFVTLGQDGTVAVRGDSFADAVHAITPEGIAEREAAQAERERLEQIDVWSGGGRFDYFEDQKDTTSVLLAEILERRPEWKYVSGGDGVYSACTRPPGAKPTFTHTFENEEGEMVFAVTEYSERVIPFLLLESREFRQRCEQGYEQLSTPVTVHQTERRFPSLKGRFVTTVSYFISYNFNDEPGVVSNEYFVLDEDYVYISFGDDFRDAQESMQDLLSEPLFDPYADN